MTAVLGDPTTAHRCIACKQQDDHPKIHLLGRGSDRETLLPFFWSFHHDCSIDTPFHAEIIAGVTGEGERVRHLMDKANSGVKGQQLRGYITDLLKNVGTGPTMVTTGMDIAQAGAILNAYHPNTGTTTVGSKTITAPINLRAMSANGASDAAAGTEITTGNSYTSGGAGLGAPTWGTFTNVSNVATLTTITAALNKTNMPARTIVGLEEWDSSGTPQRGWWGAVTPLTTNSGDTVSIAIGAYTAQQG